MRTEHAILVAVVLHLAGLLFAKVFDELFFMAIGLHLVLMAVLLVLTTNRGKKQLLGFFTICYITSMIVEIVGVRTGLVFGTYYYGEVLGPKLLNVPLVIGVNWFVVIYCSAMCMNAIDRFLGKLRMRDMNEWIWIAGGALLATLFDALLEPAAVRMQMWYWPEGQPPLLNFMAWFALSALLLSAYRRLDRFALNQFAVNLFFIQAIFFVIIQSLI